MTTETSHSSRSGNNVASFNHLQDAEAVRGLLVSLGIDAHVQDERHLQRWWLLAEPYAGIHVRVPNSQLLQAQIVVEADPDLVSLVARAVRCPECKSCQVQYPAITRKNILPALMAQLGVRLGLLAHECDCEKCQHTWEVDGPRLSVRKS